MPIVTVMCWPSWRKWHQVREYCMSHVAYFKYAYKPWTTLYILDEGAALDNSLSPQYKAYSWLVTSNGDDSLSDVLLLQRYGLGTLYFRLVSTKTNIFNFQWFFSHIIYTLYLFLFSTAGHGWTNQDGWLSDKSVCEWGMVGTCAAGSVTELDLQSNNLVGHLPVELTHVRSLGKILYIPMACWCASWISNCTSVHSRTPHSKETLDLTDNELYGTIPTQYGKFDDMEIIRMGGNLLTGNIPLELADLMNLQELYLHANEWV